MYRSGIANLPLHGGKCPPWLFKRMVKLGGEISEAIVLIHSQDELLERLADPFFFQSLGCVLGFDFHSSGLTTTTCGALTEALKKKEIGVRIAGGKGKTSRKTLSQIQEHPFSLSTDKIERLTYSSRMAAKCDTSLLQDGYDLYHHSFVYTEKGTWSVIQQGLNTSKKYARRYHWLSSHINSFVETPHNAICCDSQGNKVLDMTAKESKAAQAVSLDLVKENPQHLVKWFHSNQRTLTEFSEKKEPWEKKESQESVLHMHPDHWDLRLSKQSYDALQKAYEIQPQNYEELVSLKGIGPKSIRALTLVSELVYGTKASWKDPARYSFAHGGKDGIPEPVDRQRYDRSILMLHEALENAKLGNIERLHAIKHLQAIMQKPFSQGNVQDSEG
ncbi:DUF763 domain-containing protein [Candidatus Woesearchaeota archaeon]|nr:DUF763 domain-containing protein [Candidatus Woesearchaeota archaeon]